MTNNFSGPSEWVLYIHNWYYTDIDRDGHEISCFGGLPRELYFPEGRSIEEKYNYLGTTETLYYIHPGRYLLY